MSEYSRNTVDQIPGNCKNRKFTEKFLRVNTLIVVLQSNRKATLYRFI